MSRFLIGLLSCHKHRDRDLLALETWIPVARALGMRVVFLVGDGPGKWFPFQDGDYLHCPCPDTYPALPQKTRAFCRWALSQPDWTWLCKADNDTLIVPYRLQDCAQAIPEGVDYFGAEWKPKVAYASGGALFGLSRRATEIVARDLTARVGAEDLLVGKLLRRAGIPMHIDPRFVPFGNEQRRPLPDNGLITTHKIPDALWRETWAAFTPARI